MIFNDVRSGCPPPRRKPHFERTAQERELEAWFRGLCNAARLRPVRDEDGTLHVVGRRGEVYVHGLGRLACYVSGSTATVKNNVIRKHMPGLFDQVVQEGDTEVVLLFAPERLAEAGRVALCRLRRVLSPENRERCVEQLARCRGTRRPER